MKRNRKVIKDKKTGLPKAYLSGLKGSARAKRSSLIKTMSNMYKSGQRIPKSMFKQRMK